MVRSRAQFSRCRDFKFVFKPQGQSKLEIHAWNGTSKIDPHGYSILDKHAVVTFILEDIFDLQLDGFSPQNVLGSLELTHGEPDPTPMKFFAIMDTSIGYELRLEP